MPWGPGGSRPEYTMPECTPTSEEWEREEKRKLRLVKSETRSNMYERVSLASSPVYLPARLRLLGSWAEFFHPVSSHRRLDFPIYSRGPSGAAISYLYLELTIELSIRMASRFFGSGGRDKPKTLQVTKSPDQQLARQNKVFVSPSDFSSSVSYVKINGKYFTLGYMSCFF